MTIAPDEPIADPDDPGAEPVVEPIEPDDPARPEIPLEPEPAPDETGIR